MYRRPSKRRQLIQRVLTYVLMVVSIVSITGIVLLIVLGYRLDSESGLEQGALLQFDSQPNSAIVTVDGKELSGRTPTKTTVLPGQHSVSLSRDGYHPWQKQVNLVAGTLTWLDYGLLIPKDLPVTAIAQYPSIASVLTATNNQSMVILPNATKPELQRFDLRNAMPVPQMTAVPRELVSAGTVAGATHQFSLTELTRDGRYALMSHTYTTPDSPAQQEWLVVDTEDAGRTRNITRSVNIPLSEVHVMSTSNTNLYGVSNGVLTKLDVSAGTATPTVVTGVSQFAVIDGGIMTYTAIQPSGETILGVYQDGNADTAVVRQLAVGQTGSIAAARYYSDTYLAVTSANQTDILRGAFPHSDDEVTKLKTVVSLQHQSPVTALSFSPLGQYVLMQSDTQFQSYDLEHDRRYATDVKGGQLRWLNKATLYLSAENQLALREFDGANYHVINAVIDGTPATLSPNGRFLYSIGRAADGQLQLQRVRLILE